MKFERSSLHIDGRTVGVDVTTLTTHGRGHGKERKPTLRFDKVVARVNERLQAALSADVPGGVMVVFTLTAPIRLAAKTAVAMEAKIRTLIARSTAEPQARFGIHGNHVRMQLVKRGLKTTPALIGFVHNHGTDPRLLFNLTRELLDLANATARRRASARGLVVMCPRNSACLDAYRHIWAQLTPAIKRHKVLMVFGDGRAELL